MRCSSVGDRQTCVVGVGYSCVHFAATHGWRKMVHAGTTETTAMFRVDDII